MKFPLPYIIFETTSRCNLRCRYCYNVWKVPGHEQPVMDSYSKAKKTLRRLFRIADVKHLTFTGGEPLLAERVEELILYTRLKKKSVTLITNGSGGDKDRYQTLVSLGVDVFELPLHAHRPEIHDEITQIFGSWERSVESIKVLKGLGAYVVPVIVVTKINLPFIRETIEFIKGLGCDQIMLNRYNIGGEGFKENEFILPLQEDLRRGWAMANELAGIHALKLSSNVCTPFCLLNPSDYPNISFGSCSTKPERMPITLDIEGNLRLCNHSPVVIGNIFTTALSEIFASPHVCGWLRQKPTFCNDCELYEKCLGGCRAAALQAGQSANDVDPVMTLFKR